MAAMSVVRQCGLLELPLFHLYLKNLVRPFFEKPFTRRGNQIMFRIRGVIRNQK
jgi:hypothetical protein